ncbi:hypothetical protein DITRI_Ditri02bG0024500 [Diplodiscus trichospermus]
MLRAMQQDALDLAAKALDIFGAAESTDITFFIKGRRLKDRNYCNFILDFNKSYAGSRWQCVVGMDFSSFVIHCHPLPCDTSLLAALQSCSSEVQ